MQLNKKLLLISELKPGMILGKDIIFENKTLLAKDNYINESIIEKLKQNYIVDKVEIYLEDDSGEPLIIQNKSIEKIQLTFNRFSSNLEKIFNKISNLKTPEINEIRVFSEKIQQEFDSTGAVIKNIVFYGSGNDTIYRHSINVAAMSFILGKWLKLDETELNLLTYSAVLHDFGKTKIDSEILKNEQNLNQEELKIFETHPAIGYNFVKKIPYLNSAVSYGVLMHHEKINGSGYPLGIKGDKIHKFAKIIAIADLFDEVNSNNYHKHINGPFEALKAIQEESLGKLDCEYCTIFLNHIISYFIGENVLLNNKKSCKVIQMNINNITRPLLLDSNGFLDLKNEKDLYVQKLVI